MGGAAPVRRPDGGFRLGDGWARGGEMVGLHPSTRSERKRCRCLRTKHHSHSVWPAITNCTIVASVSAVDLVVPSLMTTSSRLSTTLVFRRTPTPHSHDPARVVANVPPPPPIDPDSPSLPSHLLLRPLPTPQHRPTPTTDISAAIPTQPPTQQDSQTVHTAQHRRMIWCSPRASTTRFGPGAAGVAGIDARTRRFTEVERQGR